MANLLSTSVTGTVNSTGNMTAAGFTGNANVGGTGAATWHPSGIYVGSTQWLYGTQYRNNSTTSGQGQLYFDGNYGYGMVGLYSAERYQAVFAMGDSYKLPVDGTGPGSLYGIAWTHTNVGGQSKAGLGHQALFMMDGRTYTAIGAGIWTDGTITTTSHGTSANWNTAYGWGNHASAGYLTSLPSHNHDDRYYTETEINNFSYFRDNEDRTLKILRFTGVGGDSGNSSNHSYAIYQGGGSWSHPYPDLHIGYHTGIKIGANTGYGGTRFYDDSTMVTELFSVGNGDSHVRAANNLYAGALYDAGSRVAISRSEGRDYINYSRYVYNNGAYSGSGWIEPSDLGVRYANSAGSVAWGNVSSRPTALSQFSNDLGNYGGWITSSGSISGNAATVTVNSGNGSASWYPILWHSGNNVYSSSGTAEIYPAGGYARFQYINTTDNDESGITRFVIKNGDSYHRSATTTVAADIIRGVASGTWSITAARANRANGNFYIDDNYGNTVVGVYTSTRFQGVFAMGDAYKLAADGSSCANHYGIAWSHPNAGGEAANLTNHGMLVQNVGRTWTAISDTIWCIGDITAFSDARVKTNIEVIDNPLERLSKVRGVTFNRTDLEHKDKRYAGVIAQEMREALPEAVSENANGELSVSYGNTVSLLIESIKAQQVQIEELKAEVKKLRGE